MISSTRATYNAGPVIDKKIYVANGSYIVKAGEKLISLQIDPNTDLAAFRIGTAAGLGDIVPDLPVAAANGLWISLNLYVKVDTTIYFSQITDTTTIRLYKQR